MKKNHQPEIHKAMMHPGIYPHPVESIHRRDTHISTVFLTGAFAYKIKKPVDLDFLDFSSLEKRHQYCLQEVALNRRLSSGVYIDAVPINHDGIKYTLGGSGTTVEFAVKMHQLAASDSMQRRLQRATLEERDLSALVHRLVQFYTQASPHTEIDPQLGLAWEKNLQAVEAFAGVWVDRRRFEFVRSAAHSFYRTHQSLFQRRREVGKIRDCHGDLRTDHIYFTKNGIQVIDCIEFNPRLRCVDIISDLAFLAMDLEYIRFPKMARKLIRLYLSQSDDIGALPLLSFYCCYRAMVRCKVCCLRLVETGSRNANDDTLRSAAERYLAMAHAYAASFIRPSLWVVCGLPASGKSTIARALAAVFDINVIRSDVIRKKLFADSSGPSAESAFEQGLYSAYATEVTYEQLFALARESLKKGQSVVIDATFGRRSQRIQALRIADYRQAGPVFVECRAAAPILAARLLARENKPSVSDARLIHLEAFKKRFEPIARIGNEIHIPVDTTRPPADCLRQILLTDSLWEGATGKGGHDVQSNNGRDRHRHQR